MRGEICTLCCGNEREVTVDCPLDCEFLMEARRHERPPAIDPDQVPNLDIRVTEEFLSQRKALVVFLGRALAEVGMGARAVDPDVREALDGLVRTYRTLQSGLQYESVPTNPTAAAVFRHVQQRLAELRRLETERGASRTRDSDVLGVLAFYQRVEFSRSNGRPRGRAFLGALAQAHGNPESAGEPPPSLII